MSRWKWAALVCDFVLTGGVEGEAQEQWAFGFPTAAAQLQVELTCVCVCHMLISLIYLSFMDWGDVFEHWSGKQHTNNITSRIEGDVVTLDT